MIDLDADEELSCKAFEEWYGHGMSEEDYALVMKYKGDHVGRIAWNAWQAGRDSVDTRDRE